MAIVREGAFSWNVWAAKSWLEARRIILSRTWKLGVSRYLSIFGWLICLLFTNFAMITLERGDFAKSLRFLIHLLHYFLKIQEMQFNHLDIVAFLKLRGWIPSLVKKRSSVPRWSSDWRSHPNPTCVIGDDKVTAFAPSCWVRELDENSQEAGIHNHD